MISTPLTAADYIKTGRLADALQALQSEVRANGADALVRISLIQLLCVMGNWDRAHAQLEVLDALGDEHKGWAGMMAQALVGEKLRREVFACTTTPLVLGEPSPWIAQLIQALKPASPESQAALRREAFEAASAVPVRIGDQDLPWLADADSRLGPVLEGIMEGKYYWIPLERIRSLKIEAPSDLRHLVWSPAEVTWVTGGESTLLIPTRYPGSEQVTDDRVRLARLTTWEDLGDGQFRGLGQRLFTAGDLDFPLLDVRDIEFRPS